MSEIYVQNKIVVDHSKIEKVKAQISSVNAAGDPSGDPSKPIFFWFQDTPVGKELFLALYTKKCEWARCSFCTLPSVSSPNNVAADNIIKQAEFAFHAHTKEQLARVKRFFISNNGSILNPVTMPPQALERICEIAYSLCSSLELISFETRFETVKKSNLLHYISKFQKWHEHYLKRGVRSSESPVKLQISAGYETQDPYLRNSVLCKGYSERLVQEFFKMCAEIHSETGCRILYDENVLLKPAPGMTNEEAIAECVQTVIHLHELGDHFNVPVSIRINPTFVAAGSYLHEKFIENKYSPPTLRDVMSVLGLCHKKNINIPIFIGLNEEDLETSGGSFNRGALLDSFYYRVLKNFNLTQDYPLIERTIAMLDDPLTQLTAKQLMSVNFWSQEKLEQRPFCLDYG
ncbi:MAG: hypothetical protein ACE5IR_05415 [bacterium]